VVARLRRITGEKTAGHAGTLDPMATGVLLVCLGQATRIAEYILDFSKEYIATIELGISTDTYDGEGRLLACKDALSIRLSDLQQALLSFQGVIEQIPPVHSAVKVGGKPSYKLARAGLPPRLAARKVTIERIDIIEFNSPYLKVLLQCSKGTYVRSLANDLGNALGCGAYLKELVRTAVGPFKIGDAATPDRIQEYLTDGSLGGLLLPLDYPLAGWGKQVLGPEEAAAVSSGRDTRLDVAGLETAGRCRAYDPSGSFLAVMKYVPETGLWHPEKVFNLN